MINCWHVFLFLWLPTSSFAEAVNCSLHVHPSAAVAIVGERVSLNCTVTSGDCFINSWQIGTNVNDKTVVYSAPQYGPHGTVTRNQYVADGYSVTNTADHKTISLLINQINISQSGLYVCLCDDTRSIATTAVVVLASEPKISVISSVAHGKPVSFSCNISFNGSADISSNLSLTDIYGTIVNRTVCYSNNRLTSCFVGHTTIANPSVDQSYICSVQLIENNITIYSRILNKSVEWKQVTSAEIVMSNPGKCSAGKCFINESITCKTDENSGTISYKWWQIHDNGSILEIGNNNQTLVLTKIGRFKYQCQAYSTISRVHYNATSKTLTIDVTEKKPDPSPNMLVVIGISVAIGIVVVVIAIFVVCICCSRRRTSRRDFRAISTDESSVPPPQRQPKNRYDKTKPTNPGQQQVSTSTASIHPAATNNSKTLDNNELTVVENDLYGETKCASPNPVATPVVCIPEENIYNEIGLHHN